MKQKKVHIRKIAVFRLYWNKKPIEEPIAQDMLRYDGAYMCERFQNIVAFIDRVPTQERWRTFWQVPMFLGFVGYINPKEWFTCIHERGTLKLTKEFMADKKLFGGQGIEWVFPGGYNCETVEDLLERENEGRR